MQVWAWSLWDCEDDPYGSCHSVCSANLRKGESRIFASREEAEIHLRKWLSAEIRRYDFSTSLNPLNKRSVQAIIDAAILNGTAKYGNGRWFFSGVTIYTRSV